MVTDCISLVRNYPCKFSFDAKEPKKSNETVVNETGDPKNVGKKSANDILDIGIGTKLGFGASAVCLGSSAMSVNTHKKIQRGLRGLVSQISKICTKNRCL